MQKVLLTAIVIGATALAASAAVSIQPTAGFLYADDGATLLPTNSLVVFVADPAGDGFGGLESAPLGPDGFTLDDDDVVLGMGSSGETAPGFIQKVFPWENVVDQDAEGKPFAMLWFDTPFTGEVAGVEPGTNYGVLISDAVVPNDGTSAAPFSFLGEGAGGGIPDAELYATNTVVPEPVTLAVLGLGGVLIGRRRRNA